MIIGFVLFSIQAEKVCSLLNKKCSLFDLSFARGFPFFLSFFSTFAQRIFVLFSHSDVPPAPGIPDIFNWDEHMAELKWEPPLRDGGAPITGNLF